MDTGTHIAIGIGLGGLATIDPTVAHDPTLFQGVLIGTVAGSLAPDFDTLLKFKSNATYIRNHRGFTHSIPAIIFWGMIITTMIYMFIPAVSFFHLLFWTLLAVGVHVIVDLFNAYGTQALRPFSRRWIAFGTINTFDPYIFFLHVAGIIAWFFGAHPAHTFLMIYIVIVLYYVKRHFDKKEIIQTVQQYFPTTEHVITSPTIKQNHWRIAIQTEERFFVGTVEHGHIQLHDEFERVAIPNTKIMSIAKSDKNIAAFLSFSPIYRWEIIENRRFIEVRFIDLRYRTRGHYPFVAVVQINHEMEIMNSYTGWIFSERKLQRKLLFGDNPT